MVLFRLCCFTNIILYDAKIQFFDEKTNYYCGEIYVICNGILLNKFVAVQKFLLILYFVFMILFALFGLGEDMTIVQYLRSKEYPITSEFRLNKEKNEIFTAKHYVGKKYNKD